ncbi:DEAD/DEAH box helicase [Pseudooceanicola nitratireducens]|uniref:DEAD/DEAH box helicase n=1 Tax=Pseudooceanicola nitratireducens TaxID=517719 RepID=UPI001C989B98|nr:DEAD/DEAH box helicase [Pseudooceanicola nitratireducens]MBY6155985.1 DEAD/DEAH box helicase [Pseudooceanicola nitratireducens]
MIQTLSDALAERGYETLTAVQQAVTDPELAGSDLLVSAQTGSGKTVGFGLAIGPTLLDDAGLLGPAATPLALIVAPTRELAFQVMRELGWLYAKTGARVTSCVGGMDMRDERRALDRGAHIVVGTPGRLRDHIQRGSLDLSTIRAVVLDEADEMLDLGFREDLEFMLGEAPEDRRTLLFSATVPPMIAKLAQQFQRDAVRVSTISDREQHADISYQALRVAQADVESAIINVLRFHEAQNAIVFANTRAMVNRLAARFANRGFQVVSLSGELSQTERTHALQAMRDGRARVCVATDVAARGIDLPNLELVIHAELPSNTEGLLHRSGRTGRAGRKGISALIVPPKATKKAERLLKFARVTAEWTVAPDADQINAKDEERLLNDPVWSDEVTGDESAFADRLLAMHEPQIIAAAYLRLYRAKHSAPEELSDPDTRAPAKDREPFGPSTWFALSVGRNDRAEPRWLLPLLCRAGGLDKTAIGAIRVQQDETYVELAEASVPEFEAKLGEGGVLEDGVSARRMEGAPEFRRAPGTALAGRAPKPAHRKGPREDREDRGPRRERPVDRNQDHDRRPPRAERPAEGDRPAKPYEKHAPREGRPEGGWSDRKGSGERRSNDGDRGFKGGDRGESVKPDFKKRDFKDRDSKGGDFKKRDFKSRDGDRPDRGGFGARSEGRFEDRPRKDRGDKPARSDRPADRGSDAPRAAKSSKAVWNLSDPSASGRGGKVRGDRAEGGKPAKGPRKDKAGFGAGFGKDDRKGGGFGAKGGKPAGKFSGKPGGKPGGKPSGKPGGKFEGRPGGKPAGKGAPRKGGNQPPRRPKS